LGIYQRLREPTEVEAIQIRRVQNKVVKYNSISQYLDNLNKKQLKVRKNRK